MDNDGFVPFLDFSNTILKIYQKSLEWSTFQNTSKREKKKEYVLER